MKQPFQPFGIKFKPLLDEIMDREKTLRELARGAAMVEILGKRSPFVIAGLSPAACGFACPLLHRRAGFVSSLKSVQLPAKTPVPLMCSTENSGRLRELGECSNGLRETMEGEILCLV